MTLSTNVYVLDETGPHELFRHAQTLLSKYDDQGRTWRQQVCSDKPAYAGMWNIGNTVGQGLPAILDIRYRPGAPLHTPEQAAVHQDYCDKDCDGRRHDRPCWLDIDFDTSYGYHGPGGIGCGGLHALLVAELGGWLDQRKLRWEWRDEFTGDVHGGDDRYGRLLELASSGRKATAWFTDIVKPAIEAHAAVSGAGVTWS